MNRIARRIVLALLGRIHTGQLVVLDGDERHVFGRGSPCATVEILDPRAWRRLLRGSRGLGTAYADGLWDTPDLTAVIRVAARNVTTLDELRRRLAPVRAPYHRLRLALRSNTPRRSRKDIAAHSDIGNALYERMLDPTML